MARARLEFPERLVDTDSRASAVIQQALAQPALGSGEQQSWRRLRERSQRSRARWLWSAVALGMAGAALALMGHAPTSHTELSAEPWPAPSADAPAAPLDSVPPARGAELLVLRAELLTRRGDCRGALEAAQRAREAGTNPSRLEALERRCRAAGPTASGSAVRVEPSNTNAPTLPPAPR